MEFANLKALVSLVENGSITLAAKDLNRVPSAITTRIQQLEDDLGVQLFLREKKRLIVTSKGLSLYEYACRIVELVSEAENQMKSDLPGGKFRLGALDSMAASRLPEPLAKLYEQYPRLELKLTTGISSSLYESLLDNHLDAIFVADAPADERLERVAVFDEELVIIASKGHKAIHEPSDITCSTVLAFKDGCSYRDRLLRWYSAYGLKPGRIAEMTSYHAILGGVSAGMGVGIVPVALLELFPNRNQLSVHQITDPLSRVSTELIWRKGMMSANILALQGCLNNSAKCTNIAAGICR